LTFKTDINEENVGFFDPSLTILHQKDASVTGDLSYFETATHRNLQIYLTQLLTLNETGGIQPRDVFNYARELHNVNLECFREAKYKTAEFLIEHADKMYYTDLWNCILLLLHDKLISSIENAQHGIELIDKIESVTNLRADVFYFREHLRKLVNPKYNLTKVSRQTLKIKQVDPVDQFLERYEYSKILPAINVYNKSKDKEEKNRMVSIIKQFVNDYPIAKDFINSIS
jgi:hypothetical protein